jgi:tetratricopeptide (TPR) repeat protein
MKAKVFFILLLSIFIVFEGSAQKDLIYYQKLVKTTANQELKLSALDSIISITKETHPKLMADYGEEFIDLALSLKHFELAADCALDLFNPINDVLNDPDRGIALIKRILPYEDAIEHSYKKGELYQMLGNGYSNGKNLKKSIESYDLALSRFTNSDSLEIADTYLYRAESKTLSGDFFGALKDYQKSYEYYENFEDKEFMLTAQQGTFQFIV